MSANMSLVSRVNVFEPNFAASNTFSKGMVSYISVFGKWEGCEVEAKGNPDCELYRQGRFCDGHETELPTKALPWSKIKVQDV